METTIIKKEETIENIPTEVSKPVIEKGVMEKLKGNMSPDEISDATVKEKAIMKESVEEKAIKEKTLKDKILSFFKIKTISEMTNSSKVMESLNEDIKNLNNDVFKDSGMGFGFGVGSNYNDAIYKYNLIIEGDKKVENEKKINDLKEILLKIKKNDPSKSQEASDEAVFLKKEMIKKHQDFIEMIKETAQQKIDQLEKKVS